MIDNLQQWNELYHGSWTWKVWLKFFKFFICNPCYSVPSSSILVSFWFIVTSCVFILRFPSIWIWFCTSQKIPPQNFMTMPKVCSPSKRSVRLVSIVYGCHCTVLNVCIFFQCCRSFRRKPLCTTWSHLCKRSVSFHFVIIVRNFFR